MAAGRGSRMKDYSGNKTLLPLVFHASPYKGEKPILMHILSSLPSGPKAVIVNYKKNDVIKATNNLGLKYCEQPELNGTGGALIAATPFLKNVECSEIIVTMGDVPFIKKTTYLNIVDKLQDNCFIILGFTPKDKKQYGVLKIEDNKVKKIVEWKYWKNFSQQKQVRLNICNSGIYAARKDTLLKYLSVLSSKPQKVKKTINGKTVQIKEFFITDLVEYIVDDSLPVGFVLSDDEYETMGIDDLPALLKAQKLFSDSKNNFK